MAKFKGKDLYLNNDDQVYFGDNAEAAMWYDASGKLQINHTVSGVAAVQPYELVILSQLTDALGGVTASGGAYGSYYAYAKSDGESSTNSITFVDKLSLITNTVTSGTYKIEWYSEMSRNSAANDVKFRVYLDSATELCNTNFRIADANSWLPLSGIDMITFTSTANHRIDIQFCGQTTNKTSYIRRARIEITRII
jgi:hypothetical protein